MIYFKYPFAHSFKSCFELKITIEKGNRVSYFSDFAPLPTHFGSNYFFTQQFNCFRNLIDYKRDVALPYDLLYVSLYLFIQKLFQVENYHAKGTIVPFRDSLPPDIVKWLPSLGAFRPAVREEEHQNLGVEYLFFHNVK